ncbi:hypothetical protein IGI04_009264 [Brassica rapa subsp. trilocularis]|uniref:Uncharacterized protein n=1 Tax=Brassica rapa subsp. trilocularis TaxID=1813537 RepID=A0ABQ7MWV1_BRACM|nr:hypothetical protein IGI04_009264 [Brassica rapa subsp. trilocularis]
MVSPTRRWRINMEDNSFTVDLPSNGTMRHRGDFRWRVEGDLLPDSWVNRRRLPGRRYMVGLIPTLVRNSYPSGWYELDIVGNNIWPIGLCFVVKTRLLSSDILVHRLWLKSVPVPDSSCRVMKSWFLVTSGDGIVRQAIGDSDKSELGRRRVLGSTSGVYRMVGRGQHRYFQIIALCYSGGFLLWIVLCFV